MSKEEVHVQSVPSRMLQSETERSVHPSVPLPSSEVVAIDSLQAPGRRPCKHTCRDKTNCLHQCCKIGVLITGATNNPRPERHLGESPLTRSHSPTVATSIETDPQVSTDAIPSEEAQYEELPTGNPPSSAVISANTANYRPCRHICSNKTQCKHQCCKTGVMIIEENSQNRT